MLWIVRSLLIINIGLQYSRGAPAGLSRKAMKARLKHRCLADQMIGGVVNDVHHGRNEICI